MNREEVAFLFKEIFEQCPKIEGKPFALMPPNADDVLSKDYQMHILIDVDESLLVCIGNIIKKKGNLAINLQKGLVVIYEPIKKDLAKEEREKIVKGQQLTSK